MSIWSPTDGLSLLQCRRNVSSPTGVRVAVRYITPVHTFDPCKTVHWTSVRICFRRTMHAFDIVMVPIYSPTSKYHDALLPGPRFKSTSLRSTARKRVSEGGLTLRNDQVPSVELVIRPAAHEFVLSSSNIFTGVSDRAPRRRPSCVRVRVSLQIRPHRAEHPQAVKDNPLQFNLRMKSQNWMRPPARDSGKPNFGTPSQKVPSAALATPLKCG